MFKDSVYIKKLFNTSKTILNYHNSYKNFLKKKVDLLIHFQRQIFYIIKQTDKTLLLRNKK